MLQLVVLISPLLVLPGLLLLESLERRLSAPASSPARGGRQRNGAAISSPADDTGVRGAGALPEASTPWVPVPRTSSG